ncbi:MAG TPA: ABC transporter permease [Actinomycetes bacterium]|nr:ABC transporter permease [Actinomycetes bacterium]
MTLARSRVGKDAPTHPGQGMSEAGLRRLLWLTGLLLIPLGWQLFAVIEESPLIVGPIEVAQATVSMTLDGQLPGAALSSGLVFVTGLALGTFAGLVIGILIGRFRTVEVILDPYVSALFATPLVAVIPILIVVLGFGFQAKVVIVAMFAFFPVTINTAAGVRAVPADFSELAQTFCSSELRTWREILVPGALPYIVTGVRLAVGRSLIAVVVAEFSTAVTGLGFLILRHSRRFNMAESLVPVIVLMCAGFALYSWLKHIENRLAPWVLRPTE